MAVYFTRLRVGYPDPLQDPPSHHNSWKVFTVCSEETKRSCSTRSDIATLRLKSDVDAEHARCAYQGLQKRAVIGLPLQLQYDKDTCHEAHSFKKNGHDHKIFRVRQGPIRVYFIYLNDKCIVLLKTWTKRKDKLSAGEQLQLENIAELVLNTVDQYGFKDRELI